jgi:hypothetical protein
VLLAAVNCVAHWFHFHILCWYLADIFGDIKWEVTEMRIFIIFLSFGGDGIGEDSYISFAQFYTIILCSSFVPTCSLQYVKLLTGYGGSFIKSYSLHYLLN